MHVHASFSEGIGSMQAHLAEAERTGVDVIWWTEHDHRMVARGFLADVHFNGLSEWSSGVKRHVEAVVSRGRCGRLPHRSCPNRCHAPILGAKAMRLSALSDSPTGATRTMTANAKNYGLNTSIDGTSVVVDVRPIDVGDDAWFDVVVVTSYRPALPGRPAGQYRMRYRIGGKRAPGVVSDMSSLDGLIVLDVPVRAWTTLNLDLVTDLEQLWPDIDFRDAALTEFSFAVTSRSSAPSTTVVDGLHFVRLRKGPDEVLDVQRELMDALHAPLPVGGPAPGPGGVGEHPAPELVRHPADLAGR